MGNPNQMIVVVPVEKLFENNYFQGFVPSGKIDYESRILNNLRIMRRGSTEEPADHPEGNAEMNTFYKQPIGYTLVANLSQKKIFAYQRASDGSNYAETRLQGKWSLGFGGHIEPSDGDNGNPIRNSMLREVTCEELEIPGRIKGFKVLGYINDDTQYEKDTREKRVSIGRVHFGILYLLDTDATEVKPNKESTTVVAKNLPELEELCSSGDVEMESWSRIALEPLRKIL